MSSHRNNILKMTVGGSMKFKRLYLGIVLAFFAVVTILFVKSLHVNAAGTEGYERYSGKCGDNLTWTFECNYYDGSIPGTLTISGTGAMYDYTSIQETPWHITGSRYSNISVDVLHLENGITHIGSNAFSCIRADTVEIPDSVTSIGDYAFGYSQLTSITIPDSVTDIGEDVFELSEKLTSVTIGSGVQEIPFRMFCNCKSLMNVNIKEGVAKIGDNAFEYCPNLASITLPESVEHIGSCAFNACENLREITFSKNVKRIETDAFDNCTKLSDVCYIGSKKDIAEMQIDFTTVDEINGIKFDNGGQDNVEYAIAVGLTGNDELVTATWHINPLKTLDYLAFAQLSYDSPPPNWQSGTVTVQEMVGGKWDEVWSHGITYGNLYANIADWYIYDYKDDCREINSNGFAAYAFRNNDGDVVIAYRGSVPLNEDKGWTPGRADDAINDWWRNDIPMILGDTVTGKTQFKYAIDFYEKIAKELGSQNVSLTGHSLGGAWGDVVSAYSGAKAVTFNAISALNAIYRAFPEYMCKYYTGINNWGFVDHLNEYDKFAGNFDRELKNYHRHSSRYGLLDGATFANHGMDSMVEQAENGDLYMTNTIETNKHSKKLVWHNDQSFKLETVITGLIPSSHKLVKLILGASGERVMENLSNIFVKRGFIYCCEQDDHVTGSKGADIIFGGQGNDLLDGSNGKDSYYYRKGDGLDELADIHGQDTIYLLDFTQSDEIAVSREGNTVNISSNDQPIMRIQKNRIFMSGDLNIIVKDQNNNDIRKIHINNLFDEVKFNKRIVIACPVHVEIFDDATGEVVQTLYNDETSVGNYYTDYGYFYVYQAESGDFVKVADLFEGYSVRIVGADEGTMDVNVMELQADGLTTTAFFEDVSVHNGMEAVLNENNDTEMLSIDDNGDGKADRLVESSKIPLYLDDITEVSNVWVDGVVYPVQTDEEGHNYVLLNTMESSVATIYTYNEDEANPQNNTPIGMRVWMLSFDGNEYSAEYIPEFENLLQYCETSISENEELGIRFITGLNNSVRNQLLSFGVSGYTLEEYGTLLAVTDQAENESLTLMSPNVKYNYAYKKGIADMVYAQKNDVVQYSNLLTGIHEEQYADMIAARPYMKVTDNEGVTFTIYGGTLYQSVGSIAWQNRDAFPAGSEEYNNIWNIIDLVYQGNYPES